MSQNWKRVLQSHVESLLRELVELSVESRSSDEAKKFRTRAEAIVADLAESQDVLNKKQEPDRSSRYGGRKKAIHYIAQFLEESDTPQTAEAITEELLAGGFNHGEPGTRANIERSITQHCKPTGKLLRERNELVGLKAWPDKKFDQERNENHV